MIFIAIESMLGDIDQKAAWLAANPWVVIFGILLGLASIIVAVIIYMKSKKTKSPFYAIRNFNLVRGFVSKIQSLEIKYAGEKIENVSVSKIAIWNGGSDVIDNRDIASLDPLTISVVHPYKILDKNIIYLKNDKNKIELKMNDERTDIRIELEFMQKGEGAIIQIIHTGKTKNDIKLTGTIKGGNKLLLKYIPQMKYHTFSLPFGKSLKMNNAYLFIIVPIILSFSILALNQLIKFLNLNIPQYNFGFSNLTLCGMYITDDVVFILIAIVLYWPVGFYMLKRRMPKGFEIFTEDLS